MPTPTQYAELIERLDDVAISEQCEWGNTEKLDTIQEAATAIRELQEENERRASMAKVPEAIATLEAENAALRERLAEQEQIERSFSEQVQSLDAKCAEQEERLAGYEDAPVPSDNELTNVWIAVCGLRAQLTTENIFKFARAIIVKPAKEGTKP